MTKVLPLIELARIKLEQSQLKEAEITIDQALQICQRCGYRLYEADAELLKARVYLAQNNLPEAKSLVQSALDKANAMGHHQPSLSATNLSEKIKTA